MGKPRERLGTEREGMADPETRPEGDSSARASAAHVFGVRPRELSPKVRARVLREALAAWYAEGYISAEQRDLLLARTEVSAPPFPADLSEDLAGGGWLDRGVAVLVYLGAVVLAAGLLVFFASNWIEFGRVAKVASLFVLTVFFYLAGFELTQEGRWRFPTLGLALVFLGCVMFAVDLMLLALIYDLTTRHVWSLLLCWVTWLGIAYLLRSRVILFLGLIGLVCWFGAEVGYRWGAYWIHWGRPVHFIGLGTLLLAMAGIHAWRAQRGFAQVYAVAGLVLIYLSTLALSMVDVQRAFGAVDWQAPRAVWWMLYAPYPLAAIALGVLHRRWPRMRLTDPPALVALLLFALLAWVPAVAMASGGREVWFVLAITVLTSAGLYLGIAWKSRVFLNTSLFFFTLNAYTRFYEYGWDAMPKSLFFIIAGATAIAGGIYV
ncbi:MAG: DUF2157 domain-containing protein, partial [Zetaproteobacteria bacterium]